MRTVLTSENAARSRFCVILQEILSKKNRKRISLPKVTPSTRYIQLYPALIELRYPIQTHRELPDLAISGHPNRKAVDPCAKILGTPALNQQPPQWFRYSDLKSLLFKHVGTIKVWYRFLDGLNRHINGLLKRWRPT